MISGIQLGERQRFRRGFRVAVAALCLVLLALLTFAQATHVHSSRIDAERCQICIAMHSAAPVVTAAATAVLVLIGTSAPWAEPDPIARQCIPSFFIRPPPVSF